jgi:virulence factor Mce-like protein
MSRRSSSRARRMANDTRVVGLLMIAGGFLILWLAFQAQTGLPWESTSRVMVEVPDAGKLTRNAEVRIGGARVGQVLSMEAVPRDGDKPAHAELEVQLDKAYGDLPVDTTSEVRLASVLGGKYLSLVPGKSSDTIPDGGRLGLERAQSSVEIEDALTVFDEEGRDGIRQLVGTLGDAMAGRGAALNETIGITAQMLPGLQRVLGSLVADRTDLSGFISALSAATGTLEPVAGELALMIGDADVTFGALDAAGPELAASIAELPGLASDAESALRSLDPVLDDAVAIAIALRPAADVLPQAMTRVDAAMRTATRVDPRIGTLAGPVDRALDAVDAFASNPAATRSLELLGPNDLATFGTSAFVGLGAILAATWDAEKHCRITTRWMAGLSDIASDGDESGNWIRMIPFFEQTELSQSGRPAADLHANPYPNENAQECEAGYEGYASGQQIGNPPGLQHPPGGGR